MILNLLKTLLHDAKGATAIEYGLLAGLISVALISGFGAASGSVQNVLTYLSNHMK